MSFIEDVKWRLYCQNPEIGTTYPQLVDAVDDMNKTKNFSDAWDLSVQYLQQIYNWDEIENASVDYDYEGERKSAKYSKPENPKVDEDVYIIWFSKGFVKYFLSKDLDF